MTRKFVRMHRAAALLLALSMAVSMAGCGFVQGSQFDIEQIKTYLDIPGVSDSEIDAIEALKASKTELLCATSIPLEVYRLPDGTYVGFATKFCSLLTELFGIDFVQQGYDWDDHISGLDSGLIDFTLEFTPTPGHMRRYYMSYPVAERSLCVFTYEDKHQIKSESDLSGLKVGFWEGGVTAAAVLKYYPDLSFKTVHVKSASAAAAMLRSGELDAFVTEGFSEMMFEGDGSIVEQGFIPPVYAPISLAAKNPALEPVISVLNKYIKAGGIDKLTYMYRQSELEYARYKLGKSLSAEELAYLGSMIQNDAHICVALDSDNYPISYYSLDDNAYLGIAPDVLAELGELTGLSFDIMDSRELPWAEVLEQLRDDKISMVSELPYSERYTSNFLWADEPYATSHYALLSKTEYPNLTNAQVIKTKVGVVRASAFDDMYSLWFPTNDNKVYFDTQNAAMAALEAGEIELLMSTDYRLYAQNNYNRQPGYKVNILSSVPLKSYFGFNKDEGILRSVIGKAQGYVKIDTIENSWISRAFDYTRRYDNERMSFLFLFTIILMLALISVAYLFLKNKRIARDYESQAVKLSTIFSTIPDMIYSKDAGFCYTSCNPSFEKLAGLREDEIIGKTADELFRAFPEMAQAFSEADERVIREGETYILEDWYTFPDGSRRLFEAIKAPLIQNGILVGVMGISRDITEHKRAEEDAYAASKAKSSFLAHMSHEIRTPMNAISGMTELIMREDMPPSIYEYVLDIRHACANMLSLINDILDFSKIEAGSLEIFPAEYSLTSLINDVLIIVRMKISEKPIIFTANIDSDIPDGLIGDETRFRQILLNVLGNASKYTNEGFVSLTLTGEITDDTVVLTCEVSDSGVGIKEADMDRLFGDFVRFDGLINKSNPGTGLGLAIVKNLCKAMDGDITVVSEYGIGSTFTITLPQQIASTGKRFATVIDPERKSVLLFKKRSIYAASIIRSLESLGVVCTLVTNKADFREELTKNSYAFVFSSCLLAETVARTIEELKLGAKLILLLDFGEVPAMRNVRTIIMPAHSASIANVLNDVEDNTFYGELGTTNMHFIAPSASILVVDDVQTNLKVTQGLLMPYQIQVDICSSGAEAIECVQKKRYDLIFMDHMMPVMDGIETTGHIRALPSEDGYYQSVPIIALTANAVSGAKELLLQSGMDDFLTKPIDMPKLSGLLEKWIPDEKKETYKKTKVKRPTEEMNAIDIQIEGIDVLAGLFTTGGSVDNYIKMLGVFHMDGTEKIDKLRECVEQGDIKLYTIFVHALKSASLSIGALEVSNFAKTLEIAGDRGDIGFIRDNTDRFLTELETLLQNIEAVTSAARSESGADYTPEFIRGQLEALAQALAQMDAVEVDDIMNTLTPVSWQPAADGLFTQITKHICLFDYDNAAGLIGDLLNAL